MFFATSAEQMGRGTPTAEGPRGAPPFLGLDAGCLVVEPLLPGACSLSGLSGRLASASLALWHMPPCSF